MTQTTIPQVDEAPAGVRSVSQVPGNNRVTHPISTSDESRRLSTRAAQGAYGLIVVIICATLWGRLGQTTFPSWARQSDVPLLNAVEAAVLPISETPSSVYVITQDRTPGNNTWFKIAYGLIPLRTPRLPTILVAVGDPGAKAVDPPSGGYAQHREHVAFSGPAPLARFVRSHRCTHLLVIYPDPIIEQAVGLRLPADSVVLLALDSPADAFVEVNRVRRP